MTTLAGSKLRHYLQAQDIRRLFIEELGWDRVDGGAQLVLQVDDRTIALEIVVQKLGVPLFVHRTPVGLTFPLYAERRRIEAVLAKRQAEHLLVFIDEASKTQVWQWVKREPRRPAQIHEHSWHPSLTNVEGLRQKLARLLFTFEEQEAGTISVVEVTGRLQRAFDADKITKRFYDDFQTQHTAFLKFLAGIPDKDMQSWYASVMLNRLMFIYFVQKKGFLDGNADYLRVKLKESKGRFGSDEFYRKFLCPLFFDGFARPRGTRTASMNNLFGEVPYLDGGLFQKHQIEEAHGTKIDIPDRAFAALFAFFEQWNWHLEEVGGREPVRGLSESEKKERLEREINPDVLGYIFEKYVNQRQMGAYYTKEDITEYICANTILPRLLDMVREGARSAFEGESSVWRLLAEYPDRYIWPAALRGIDQTLPDEIILGVSDAAKREVWNRLAEPSFSLPTETWRAHVHRRERAKLLRDVLRKGVVANGDMLVTLNLNIRQFAQDAIQQADETQLKSWWDALTRITVLDPACGSGAFLFAALNILEPLYEAALDGMQAIIDDAKRIEATTEKRIDPRRYKLFADTLEDAARHPNRAYFVLKTIALNNLFGVDIMEEAAEICKLRMFLKLVAQLEDVSQIEPLPDLDFNIRAGNSLVGLVVRSDFDRLKEPPLDYDDVKRRIEEEAEVADLAFRRFRNLQIVKDANPDDLATTKTELRNRLAKVGAQCNVWLARQYGKDPNNRASMGSWLASHQPFNWFTEFIGVFKAGGFDAVVGNPPYVNKSKVNYIPAALGEPVFPDIYGNFVLRALRLKASAGRCGLIVPLSMTFSEEFVELRRQVLASGANWISSFDNIPAALFTGVSQRCSIWINSPHGSDIFTAPMYRWRADYRPCLIATLGLHGSQQRYAPDYGLPKLADGIQEAVLVRHMAASKQRPEVVFGGRNAKHAIGFAAAARNFISVFTELPPELDGQRLTRITKTKASFVPLASHVARGAALASLSGSSFFWYWLVRGDGFDVTSWIIRDFLGCLGGIESGSLALLAELGELIDHRRFECLVFKKNAGKFVGNFNYEPLAHLTHAADDVLLHALGVQPAERQFVYDFVERVLSINEFAGEKSIPEKVKAKFPPKPFDKARERDVIQRALAYVASGPAAT